MHMKKPRITVSLEPDDYAVLADLSAVNGESMSSIVAGLVSAVTPALSRVADLLRVATTAQGDVLENLRLVAEESEAVMSPLLQEVMEAVEVVEGETARVVEAGGGDPRPVTRGSGLLNLSTFRGSK